MSDYCQEKGKNCQYYREGMPSLDGLVPWYCDNPDEGCIYDPRCKLCGDLFSDGDGLDRGICQACLDIHTEIELMAMGV